MLVLVEKAQEFFIGYAIIFACISIGFLWLRLVNKKEHAVSFFIASSLANCTGFFFWSTIVTITMATNYYIGEVLHVFGFLSLLIGVILFIEKKIKLIHAGALVLVVSFWIASFILYGYSKDIALAMRSLVRSAIFMVAAGVLFLSKEKITIGRVFSGSGFMFWGLYQALSVVVEVQYYIHYGILVGLHLLAALGLVAMIMDNIRRDAEKKQVLIRKLEGILPICAYCKRIRDENNKWHVLEQYIEDRSNAEFSHGICPDCFSKHRPDK